MTRILTGTQDSSFSIFPWFWWWVLWLILLWDPIVENLIPLTHNHQDLNEEKYGRYEIKKRVLKFIVKGKHTIHGKVREWMNVRYDPPHCSAWDYQRSCYGHCTIQHKKTRLHSSNRWLTLTKTQCHSYIYRYSTRYLHINIYTNHVQEQILPRTLFLAQASKEAKKPSCWKTQQPPPIKKPPLNLWEHNLAISMGSWSNSAWEWLLGSRQS